MSVDAVMKALDQLAEQMRHPGCRGTATAEAALACVEAAQTTWRLLADQSTEFEKAGQEALEAMRAAVLTVRFALVEQGDSRREAA